jgi:hypothetical protein
VKDWGPPEYAEVTAFGRPPRLLRVGPTLEQKRDALIGLARDSYACGDMTLSEFEIAVEMALADRPVEIVTSDGGRIVAYTKPWKGA